MKDSRLYFAYSLFQNLNLAFLNRREYFGQTEEDRFLVKWLPEVRGVYLDIGAGQPVCGSNTYHFYRKGWRGFCVDPIANNCKMLRLIRRGDSTIQGLVSTNRGKMKFWEFIPYEYSTTVPEVAEKLMLTEGVRLKQVQPLDVFPLSRFAPRMTPQSPTLLSVDVEGADLEVLKSNDWSTILPRVICVEELASSLSGDKSEIRLLLEDHGYILSESTVLSSIFVHSSYLKSIRNRI